tara:strand:- start:524 stop:775 length:252 start_codon:yes stop_codon:yes gene_type:complete
MKVDLRKMTRDFLLGEGKTNPSAIAYVESVLRIIDEVRPRSLKENRKFAIVRDHLRELKKSVRILENKILLLEEQIKILEEGK